MPHMTGCCGTAHLQDFLWGQAGERLDQHSSKATAELAVAVCCKVYSAIAIYLCVDPDLQ